MRRREFAEAIALAALVPVLGSGVAPVSLPSLEGAAAAGDAAALAKALAGAIRAQYADRLTDAELAVITRQIEASLDRAAKVRTIPLANSHEPDFRFSAVRAADHG